MAGSIVHEINQPLTAIATNADAGLRWIDRTPPDLDRIRKSFSKIVHARQRTADVIQGIRAMFKSEETSRSSIDVNELINEMLTLIQGQLQKHTIAVHTELAKVPLFVMANRVQVQQVLFNLVTNAIEAMDTVFDRSRLTGMGMGLSICRSIIESHGGRLWASPGHPHGTVFHFTLPVGKLD